MSRNAVTCAMALEIITGLQRYPPGSMISTILQTVQCGIFGSDRSAPVDAGSVALLLDRCPPHSAAAVLLLLLLRLALLLLIWTCLQSHCPRPPKALPAGILLQAAAAAAAACCSFAAASACRPTAGGRQKALPAGLLLLLVAVPVVFCSHVGGTNLRRRIRISAPLLQTSD